MQIAFRALVPLAAFVSASAGAAETSHNPMRFFEGRTESEGTIKIALKKAYRTHSTGRGKIQADGTLVLIQQVRDGNAPPKERRWVVRQTAPGKFSGTMTEAVGPVTIEQVGDRFRFRFKMKGGLSAEQWIKPAPSGLAATTRLTVRKLGLTVATSVGTIRKLGVR